MTPAPFDSDDFRSRKDDPVRNARRTAPFVIIDCRSSNGPWTAIWGDKVDRYGKFKGTREEVIAWARERCDDIRICDDPDDEYAPLRPLRPDD